MSNPVIGLALASLIAAAAGSPTFAGQAATPAATAPPVVISASCDLSGDTPTLRVRLQNRADRPISLVLGKLVGDDRTQVIDSLYVMATRLATGAAEDFAFVNPKHAMLKGRTAPWIVTLPAGGTYDIDAPIRDFVSRLNYSFLEPAGLPGTRILLDAKAAPNDRTVWVGEVEAAVEGCR